MGRKTRSQEQDFGGEMQLAYTKEQLRMGTLSRQDGNISWSSFKRLEVRVNERRNMAVKENKSESHTGMWKSRERREIEKGLTS